MESIKLDHCVIHVSEWERSNRFYQDVLGAELVPVGAGWSYRFGEAQLNCHGPNVEGTPNAQLPVMPGGSDLISASSGPDLFRRLLLT
ncbi:MAG TPA: VOC family protein [Ktedonobacterales bacterium]|jgi:catechol 2,3-dioxygenase-like lactoylglutathione lyase family enzyme